MVHSQRNLFAYTDTDPAKSANYPSYVSINEIDDRVAVSVRSEGNGGREHAAVYVPLEQLEAMAHALLAYVEHAKR